jgi:hypothetical protein
MVGVNLSILTSPTDDGIKCTFRVIILNFVMWITSVFFIIPHIMKNFVVPKLIICTSWNHIPHSPRDNFLMSFIYFLYTARWNEHIFENWSSVLPDVFPRINRCTSRLLQRDFYFACASKRACTFHKYWCVLSSTTCMYFLTDYFFREQIQLNTSNVMN